MADTVLLKENGAPPGLRWSVLVVPWDNLKVSIRSARSRLLTSDDARGFQALGKQGFKTIHFASFARRFDSPGESPLVRLRLILFPLFYAGPSMVGDPTRTTSRPPETPSCLVKPPVTLLLAFPHRSADCKMDSHICSPNICLFPNRPQACFSGSLTVYCGSRSVLEHL